MRKCLDCGQTLNDIDMKCTKCGSKNLSMIDDEQDNQAVAKPKAKKKTAVIISSVAAAIVAICIIIGGALMVIRNTETEPVTAGIKSMMSGDLDGYVERFHPAFQDAIKGAFLQTTTADDYQKQQQEGLEKTYGSDYRIYVNAIDVKGCSDKTVESLNSDYEDAEVTFEDAKYVTVSIFISGSTGENYQSRSVYSVKIDGKWYMFEDFSVSAE